METMTVRKILTSVLALYCCIRLKVCKQNKTILRICDNTLSDWYEVSSNIRVVIKSKSYCYPVRNAPTGELHVK